MNRTAIPPIALALALAPFLAVLGSGTAAAELVAGGWLTPPPIPKAEPLPPPPREAVPVVPVARHSEPPPRPRHVSPAPIRQAPPPPSDGKVRF